MTVERENRLMLEIKRLEARVRELESALTEALSNANRALREKP